MEAFASEEGDDFVEVLMYAQVDIGPIIEPSALEFGVVEFECHRFDDVQMRIGPGAKPSDSAGIGGNFGFDEDDVKVFIEWCADFGRWFKYGYHDKW